MNYLQIKIAKYLYSKLLIAFNVKGLSTMIQSQIKEQLGISKDYQKMSEQEKRLFNDKLNQKLKSIEDVIIKITNNIQYQDLIASVAKTDYNLFCTLYYAYNYEINQITDLLKNYEIIKKHQQDKKFKNINNFKNLQKSSKRKPFALA